MKKQRITLFSSFVSVCFFTFVGYKDYSYKEYNLMVFL